MAKVGRGVNKGIKAIVKATAHYFQTRPSPGTESGKAIAKAEEDGVQGSKDEVCDANYRLGGIGNEDGQVLQAMCRAATTARAASVSVDKRAMAKLTTCSLMKWLSWRRRVMV